MNTDARPPSAKTQITVEEWLRKGEELFGANRDDWQFKCTSCGHIQSATAARHRAPGVDAGKEPHWLRNYLARNCEGRLTGGVGCDWSLGGLFQIHKLEVIDDGEAFPIFEFTE